MDKDKIRGFLKHMKLVLTAKTEELYPEETAVEGESDGSRRPEVSEEIGSRRPEASQADNTDGTRRPEAYGPSHTTPSGDARVRANGIAKKIRDVLRRVIPSPDLSDKCLTIMYANEADGLILESAEFGRALDLMIESGFDSEFQSVEIRKKDAEDRGLEVDKGVYINITRPEEEIPEEAGAESAAAELSEVSAGRRPTVPSVTEDYGSASAGRRPTVPSMTSRPVVRISAMPGHGSLREESYTIDSPGHYDIGAGTSRRHNFIVINDDENDPEYKKNAYVSRSHAHIEYCDDGEVLFFVDQGGTRFNHKRTHLMRTGKVEEIESTFTPKVLADNDIIILSKNVQLRVEISASAPDVSAPRPPKGGASVISNAEMMKSLNKDITKGRNNEK